MPFENEDYVKILFVDNLLITMLVIFVLVYIYYNFEILNADKCYLNGDFKNPILITAVIALISLLVIGDKYESKVGGTKDEAISNINDPIVNDIKPTNYTIIKNTSQLVKPIIENPISTEIIKPPSTASMAKPTTGAGIDFISPTHKGGNKSYQLKQNDIFIPQIIRFIFIVYTRKNEKYNQNQILNICKFNLMSREWKCNLFALGGVNSSNVKKVSMTKSQGAGFISFINDLKIQKPVYFFQNRRALNKN